ncbi:MAG: ABC transporter ATP-binding protein [Candidatus Thermofonsia Clade 1 bacterium]|jgi:simple sugar transport system ATP-binding protein|uniref:ABC transporter ATP-binding protein n=1 Tax=Candidatus Thermofonsia Clade 1 bacterium TaxID=2364210 RepID=A0A2M8PI18_9CHLR|nr:MAG: ABC transporter ATP-binding protein [Candidatus Thermofonsia Clade 1 bacterium]RMF49971.1 MAG: ABC transporter ATP-binding protein [Chloroflexota bacterium]
MPTRLQTRDISKVYPNGVRANDRISIAVAAGQVHAIVGENGAGKSTLMKILYGMERPTEGEILLDGERVQFHSPQDAIRRGIGMVHQNFMLVPSFTVAQNVVLNAEPTRLGALDVPTANARVQALAARYGLPIAPELRVAEIPVGMKQRVEILKALYRGAEILILDEPTAVLTPSETRELFGAMRELAASGKSVLFISHKLREVLAVSDQVTVLRDGRLIDSLPTSQCTERHLATLMVGREVFMNVQKPPLQRGAPILKVDELTVRLPNGKVALDRISFRLHSGEILGVAGVEGNGQTELAESLAGLRAFESGKVTLCDRPLPNGDPRAAREAGVAHIPEDRLKNGSALELSIAENLIVDRYYKPPFSAHGSLNLRAIRQNAQRLIERFNIVARSPETPLGALSGGNMQKVVLARELSAAPRLLIAAQPTRGVDIGAIEFIHAQLIAARAHGVAILLISADLSEVLRLSDRLIVLYNGQIVAHFEEPSAVSEEELGLYMLGSKRMA